MMYVNDPNAIFCLVMCQSRSAGKRVGLCGPLQNAIGHATEIWALLWNQVSYMLNKRAIYYQVSYTFCFNCLISVHTAFPERGLLGMHGYSACKDSTLVLWFTPNGPRNIFFSYYYRGHYCRQYKQVGSFHECFGRSFHYHHQWIYVNKIHSILG